jgi:hypothetical protein
MKVVDRTQLHVVRLKARAGARIGGRFRRLGTSIALKTGAGPPIEGMGIIFTTV